MSEVTNCLSNVKSEDTRGSQGNTGTSVLSKLASEDGTNESGGIAGALVPPLLDPELEENQKRLETSALLPLLQSALTHCEKATWNLSDSSLSDQDFSRELERCRERGMKGSEDSEADEVILSGVEVLRVNFLELKKVNQLCKEFCDRYIVAIKRRMNQETLLGFSADSDDESYDISTLKSSALEGKSPGGPGVSAASSAKGTVATLQTPQGPVSVQLYRSLPQFPSSSTAAPPSPNEMGLLGSSASNNNTKPLTNQHPHSTLNILSGTTGSSSPRGSSLKNDASSIKIESGGGRSYSEFSSALDSMERNGMENSNQKRTSLPRQAVDILRQWLFQHAVHPYPTESEKRQIALDTGLNLMQVNNWFINARRRILQPLIEDPGSSSESVVVQTEGNTSPHDSEASPEKKTKWSPSPSPTSEAISGSRSHKTPTQDSSSSSSAIPHKPNHSNNGHSVNDSQRSGNQRAFLQGEVACQRIGR